MTLPNKLSLTRIALIPLILAGLLYSKIGGDESWVTGAFRVVSLLAVIAASITDYYDGALARRHNLVTNLGKLLDPLADKLLVSSVFIAFVDLQIFPSWLIIIILFREFLVTGLRSIAASQGRIIAAERWGKHKTGWQIGTMITAIAFMCIRDFCRAGGVWNSLLVRGYYADVIFNVILHLLLLVCVFFALLSGWLYFWNHRDLLQEER